MPARPTLSPFLGVSAPYLLLRKRALRHGVEARRVLRQILLPAFGIPEFQVIANADEDHLMPQAGELHQPIRNEDASGAIDIDRFGLGEIEPAKDPGLG